MRVKGSQENQGCFASVGFRCLPLSTLPRKGIGLEKDDGVRLHILRNWEMQRLLRDSPKNLHMCSKEFLDSDTSEQWHTSMLGFRENTLFLSSDASFLLQYQKKKKQNGKNTLKKKKRASYHYCCWGKRRRREGKRKGASTCESNWEILLERPSH